MQILLCMSLFVVCRNIEEKLPTRTINLLTSIGIYLNIYAYASSPDSLLQ